MQIQISIALTDLLTKLQNIMIKRFHLNTVGGKGWGGGGGGARVGLQSDVLKRNPPGNWVIIL